MSNTKGFISIDNRCYTITMSKPVENKFYKETLLTLNANSSDDHVKSIYDDIAEKYDKVLCTFFGALSSLAGSDVLRKLEVKSVLLLFFNK